MNHAGRVRLKRPVCAVGQLEPVGAVVQALPDQVLAYAVAPVRVKLVVEIMAACGRAWLLERVDDGIWTTPSISSAFLMSGRASYRRSNSPRLSRSPFSSMFAEDGTEAAPSPREGGTFRVAMAGARSVPHRTTAGTESHRLRVAPSMGGGRAPRRRPVSSATAARAVGGAE